MEVTERVKFGSRIFLSLILGYICVYGVTFGAIDGSLPLVSSSGIFAVIFWVMFSCLFYFTFRVLSRRLLCCSIWAAFILAVCIVTGAEFYTNGTINWSNRGKYVNIIALACIFVALLMLFIEYLPQVKNKMNKCHEMQFFKKYFKPEKKTFFFSFVFIIICWLPAFLAMFPGNFSYDAIPQLDQIYVYDQFSAHSPLLHTLFLQGCLQMGKILFGSYNAGVVIHSLIQGGLLAAVFAYTIYFLSRFTFPKILLLISLLFFAINPIMQIWAFTTTKDILFGAMFLLLFLFTLEVVLLPEHFFALKIRQVRYAMIVFLLCIFRNQGIYVFVLAVPFLVWVCKYYRKKMLLLSIIIIILVQTGSGLLEKTLDATSQNPREALSVPMQQITRVMNLHSEELSADTKEKIYELIPKDYIQLYFPYISDPVKTGFNSEILKQDLGGYFKLWIQLGLQYPGVYADAFFGLSYGYWYPEVKAVNDLPYIMYDGAFQDRAYSTFGIERKTLFPAYDRYLRKVSLESLLTSYPVVSLINNEAIPFWVILITISILIYRKKIKLIAPLILLIAFWGTLILGPVTCSRYVFPLLICVPVLCCFMFSDEFGVVSLTDRAGM